MIKNYFLFADFLATFFTAFFTGFLATFLATFFTTFFVAFLTGFFAAFFFITIFVLFMGLNGVFALQKQNQYNKTFIIIAIKFCYLFQIQRLISEGKNYL